MTIFNSMIVYIILRWKSAAQTAYSNHFEQQRLYESPSFYVN